jgi:phospholipase C
MPTDRRTFLQLLTAGAAAAAFPPSIARALAIPANNATGTIKDVEHIVILMQENRSFDHYFGTLKGVRGYGDPRAVKLSSGESVFNQPANGGSLLPFHPGAPNLGLQFIQDLAHDWDSTHAAWNNGQNDQWVPQKGTTTMAHLNRSDIPFHYALADAFTICDAYHCSLLGPTDPNRYYMWTGWVGNDGKLGGPVIDNAEAGYDWHTYPERLAKAGVSWKIYQDKGEGLDAAHFWGWTGDDPYIGNYGDNSLLYFHQYQNSAPGSPLNEGALQGTEILKTGTLFDQFRADVEGGTLPQVSWIVAPESYTEHPNWPANYGAWYVSQMLDILTSNPDMWSKTAFFLTYDENDGFFDHVPPPTVPPSSAQGKSTVSTINELFNGSPNYPASSNTPGPYGMGIRVPMLVISPWSKGGYVDSEVFDHTSIIRFIEQRFGSEFTGLTESNITPWRRAISGDLTSAFNFKTPNDSKVSLPSTSAYVPPDNDRHPDYVPAPPVDQALPAQETGTRPARPVPYELHSFADVDATAGTVTIHFSSANKAAVFHVRSGDGKTGPWMYTIGSGASLSDVWTAGADGTYDLSVYGPNGFFRSFKGSVDSDKVNVSLHATYNAAGNSITVAANNLSGKAIQLRATDGYTGESAGGEVAVRASVQQTVSLSGNHGWYDFIFESDTDASFRYQLAGHLETGKESITDPAIAVAQ